MRYNANALLGLALLAGSLSAQAGIIKIDQSAFIAGSGQITFGEFAVGTVNPVYNPANYGGGAGAPIVNFGGWFNGQSNGGAVCGGAATGCVVGSPSGPLSLAAGSPVTSIVDDSANPTSPVLSGTPIFNGSIAILFSTNLAGVGLDGGFFDAIGGTAITAFARDGALIGQVTNTRNGIEFLGLVTDDGSERIAGLLFSLVGAEPAGFGIDNVRFGRAGQVVVPNPGGGGRVAEPASLALLGLGVLGLMLTRRRRA